MILTGIPVLSQSLRPQSFPVSLTSLSLWRRPDENLKSYSRLQPFKCMVNAWMNEWMNEWMNARLQARSWNETIFSHFNSMTVVIFSSNPWCLNSFKNIFCQCFRMHSKLVVGIVDTVFDLQSPIWGFRNYFVTVAVAEGLIRPICDTRVRVRNGYGIQSEMGSRRPMVPEIRRTLEISSGPSRWRIYGFLLPICRPIGNVL